jgi:hypothetical protein
MPPRSPGPGDALGFAPTETTRGAGGRLAERAPGERRRPFEPVGFYVFGSTTALSVSWVTEWVTSARFSLL